MATGMVSSAQTLQNSTVLRAGEKVASTATAIKNPNAKTFYHMDHGAKFVMPDGLEVIFMGGTFVTDDAAIIAELDQVANKAASRIYTQVEVVQQTKQLTSKAAADAADTAGKTPE